MITAMTSGCAAEHVEMSCNDWRVRSCGVLPSSLLFHISRGRISVPSFRRLGIRLKMGNRCAGSQGGWGAQKFRPSLAKNGNHSMYWYCIQISIGCFVRFWKLENIDRSQNCKRVISWLLHPENTRDSAKAFIGNISKRYFVDTSCKV